MKLMHKGLQRSGTNLAETLIRKAFGITLWSTKKPRPKGVAEKHKLIAPDTPLDDTTLLVLLKNPYAWIVSIYAWRVTAKANGTALPEVKEPVTWNRGEMDAVIQQYNGHHRNWLTQRCEVVAVRCEDVILDVDALIAPLEAALGRKRKATVRLPKNAVQAGHAKYETSLFDTAYYTEHAYLERLTEGQHAQITDNIDWDLFKGLYTPVGVSG